MIRRSAAVSAFVMMAAGPAWAGALFDVEVTDASGAVVETGQIKAEDGKMIMPSMAGPDMAADARVVFRGDLDPPVIYAIQDSEQRYMVIEPAKIASGISAMQSQVQSMMADAMKDMSPERRAQVEAMMNANGGAFPGMPGAPAQPAVTVQQTGQTRTVNGVSTTGYEVIQNGVRSHMIWTASAGDVTGGAELVEGFAALADLLAAMPQGMTPGAVFDMDALDNRMPLQIEDYQAGAVTRTTTMSNGRIADIPDAEFAPDPSYSEQSMFGGL